MTPEDRAQAFKDVVWNRANFGRLLPPTRPPIVGIGDLLKVLKPGARKQGHAD
jgi:hypothetical protein